MPDWLSRIATNPYIIAMFLYLFVLVGVGAYKAKSVKGSDDFMVAGRRLPWFVLVGTLLATWMGTGSLFSGAGLGFRNGLSGLWMNAGAWVGIVFIFFIAKRIRNLGGVTVPDIFRARYGNLAASLATVTTVIAYLTIVSYQFKGGGRILNIITDGDISVANGIVITAVFATLYTVLAGMLSVVYTDVVNGVIMMIGVFLGLGFLLAEVGGAETVVQSAEAAGKWTLFGHWHAEVDGATPGEAPAIAFAFLIPTMLLLLGDANMYQRIFSAKDGGSARKAVFFWVIGVVLLEGAINVFGLVGSVAVEQEKIVLAPDATENIIPVVATATFMPKVIGLVLVATMMAIAVSTADSFLLIPATNLTRDVYQVLRPGASERFLVGLTRVLILVLAGIAYLLVQEFETVLEAAVTAYTVYGAAIAPALLAAFLWKRATAAGAVASILAGTIVTLVWAFVLPRIEGIKVSEWGPFLSEPTYPAAGLSIAALIFVSLATAAPSSEVYGRFFAARESS